MLEKIIEIDGEIEFGFFLNRPNRFLVNLRVENTEKIEPAYLHDPGRMKELLLPNAKLAIRKPINYNKRKTKWDILAVNHYNQWITINSSLPNKVAKIALSNKWFKELSSYTNIKPEVKVGNSRLDFLLTNQENQCFVEVKGVTLVKDNRAFFPDAPTSRGTRHLQELINLRREGFRTVVLFLCMRNDPIDFSPNWKTDPIFSNQLIKATENDVEILVYKISPRIVGKKLILALDKRINVVLTE